MKELHGRNALLTGASRGLGPYIGRALAERGVNVALTARTAVGVRTTADAMCPGMMRRVLRTCGVYEFFRRQAEENERARRESPPSGSPTP